jgi:hypothetical protein
MVNAPMKTEIGTGVSHSIQAEKVFAEITCDGARAIAGIMKKLPLGTSNVVSLDATFATNVRVRVTHPPSLDVVSSSPAPTVAGSMDRCCAPMAGTPE